MNIFAIDLGNKRIKMKSDRGEYVYPASYLTAENVTRGVLGGWKLKGNQVYSIDKTGENRFVWGTELEAYHLSEKMIDTYARSGRIEQKKTQRILEFALGRLALDYKEARTKPLVVQLVLGVPITDLHEESRTIQILKELMIGRHYIRVDGEELIIEIPSEDSILVIPQYMGTAFELAYDEGMHPVDEYVNGRMGVLDIGGGTILINTSNRLNPAPMGAERFEGIQTLIKIIAGKINSTKLFTIEQLLREGSSSGTYIYRPNRNVSDSKDISFIVKKSIEDYTRFTVAPLVTENFPDIEDIDFIIMTGGGANIVDKTALLDEIGQEYFNRLIFIEASELANVRGFYKYAFLIWNGSREVREPEKMEEVRTISSVSTAEETHHPVYSEQLKQVQTKLNRLREEIEQEI